MFPEDALFAHVLEMLAEQLAAHTVPEANPMRCDRWLARSLLQKACRRREVALAQRALATLLAFDRYAIWRHLIVIGLEDVGVAGFDVVAAVIAAGRHRSWRTSMGGEWAVASFLVQLMCESPHCQATCDLLLCGLNRPEFETARAGAIDAEMDTLAAQLAGPLPLLERGIAALAVGGGLAEGQRLRDPAAVFDILADRGYSSHVVATCRAAWRSTRNEMAFLLPLVWREWMAGDEAHQTIDDEMSPVGMIGELPGYAVDQFTRAGGQVARTLLTRDRQLRDWLDTAGVPRARQPKAVGDLIFLAEGSAMRGRAVWSVGDQLRLPYRALANAVGLGDGVWSGVGYIAANAPIIASIRRHTLLPGGS